MAKKGWSFTVKTPHESVSMKTAVKFRDIFMDEVEKRAIKIGVGRLALSAKTEVNRTLTIAATFFQRVCSRTPLDEDYIIGVTEEGKEIWHRADKVQCRMDWYAEYDGRRLLADDVAQEFPSIFDKYNDSGSIDLIKEMMKEKFRIDPSAPSYDIAIGNENPHFATLEYGGYKKDSDKYNTGVDKGLEHGVKNKHSVQAPVGMLRITQMELESMARSSAFTNLAKRYRQQRTTQVISETKLKSLLQKFKASKRLVLSDIKEYLQ